MSLTGKHIIGNGFEASSDESFYAINPASGESLEVGFFEGTPVDVDKAAKLAKRDFDSYRATSNKARAAFLEAIAEEIEKLGPDLIDRAMAETGLPNARLVGERGRTVNQLRLFAQAIREGSWVDARIDTAIPDRSPLPKPDIRMMHTAIGPAVVFGASNFPLAFSVAGGDTASALAAGCPVIVKGHQAHPGTSEFIGRAIQAAVRRTKMPDGTFSLIQGNNITVGEALVKHPAIKAVGFTGSFKGGKALFDLAASRPEPIPLYAEMGSTNPVFLLPGAVKERGKSIAQGLADSATLGAGQFCTNPGLVFGVGNHDYDIFIDTAVKAMAKKAAETMLHSGIRNNYEHGIQDLTGMEGVELIATGGLDSAHGCTGIPRLLKTTAKTFQYHARLEEEVFGPSSLLVVCDSSEQLLEIAARLKGHLTATIHGTDEELAKNGNLITILEKKVGRIIFNGFPTGVEVCHSMTHGGPFPATTDSRSTSVGTAAIKRFLRPVCYQNFPQASLPDPLKNENPAGIWRLVNGEMTQKGI
jgi:NADP-dependent aldehyde dehydrogenase